MMSSEAHLWCDGKGCLVEIRGEEMDDCIHDAIEAGWVFIQKTFPEYHYCPSCAGKIAAANDKGEGR